MWGIGASTFLVRCAPPNDPDVTAAPELVPFSTIHRGSVYGASTNRATVVVLDSAREKEALRPWPFGPDASAALDRIDFGKDTVLAVFRARVGSTGYGILVEEVRVARREVVVAVGFEDPPPENYVNLTMTHPYHLIAVGRAYLPRRPIKAVLMRARDGTILATEAV